MIQGRMRSYGEPRGRLAPGRHRDSSRTTRRRRVDLAADPRPEHAASARPGRPHSRRASHARSIRRPARVRVRGGARVPPRDRPARRRNAHARGPLRRRAGDRDRRADRRRRGRLRARRRHRRSAHLPTADAGRPDSRSFVRRGSLAGGATAVAARVTRHIDTVDVAGIAFQLSCRLPKPSFWARRRPELVTRRWPDVVVRIEYAEGYGGRAGRPVGDTVADAARVRRHGRGLLMSTGYYRAAVDRSRGRVAVRMAAGFEVGGLMRSLAALWLLERQTLLIHAACFGPAASATLACGLPDGATPLSAFAGWLAVTPR